MSKFTERRWFCGLLWVTSDCPSNTNIVVRMYQIVYVMPILTFQHQFSFRFSWTFDWNNHHGRDKGHCFFGILQIDFWRGDFSLSFSSYPFSKPRKLKGKLKTDPSTIVSFHMCYFKISPCLTGSFLGWGKGLIRYCEVHVLGVSYSLLLYHTDWSKTARNAWAGEQSLRPLATRRGNESRHEHLDGKTPGSRSLRDAVVLAKGVAIPWTG